MSNSIMEDDDDHELTQQIEEQVSQWSTNSTECFTVQLLNGDGSLAAEFQPEFTYAMFGQEEAIFGYQDLSITLSFRAHDLQPKLDIKYGKIFQPQGNVQPTDIKDALQDFLPASAFKSELLPEEADFQPPGEKIHEYKRNGKPFETWCASLADPNAKKLLENMQILVPLFIDGGTIIEMEQDWTAQRWKIFLVYEVDHTTNKPVSPYKLAGYGTSYRTFTFPERQKPFQGNVFSPSSKTLEDLLPSPDAHTNQLSQEPDFQSPLDLPSRERLSQFLLLPPWHGSGHGQELYSTMFKHLTASPSVREFAVEDPNEKFDDLRDLCDLLYLRAKVPEFAALKIRTDIPPEKMKLDENIPTELIVPLDVRKSIMQNTKIMPRQFDRLVEMHTLSSIPSRHRSRSRITKKEKASDDNDKAYYLWRLYCKQRLYVFNRDQLAQVEHEERIEKLESALNSVIEQYTECIEKVEAREHTIANEEVDDAEVSFNSCTSKRKRRIVTDDEEEDGERTVEDEESLATDTNGHKKSKVE